jgi:hypothetical protein
MDNSIGGTPLELLAGGSRVITLSKPRRVFTVRDIAYDESMTPVYASPCYAYEQRYQSLPKLLNDNSTARRLILDSPILDLDNSLKVFEQ